MNAEVEPILLIFIRHQYVLGGICGGASCFLFLIIVNKQHCLAWQMRMAFGGISFH